MKFLFTATIATLASFVAASPTPTVNIGGQVYKRASPEDACDIGYASTNGGYVLIPLLHSHPKLTDTAHLWQYHGRGWRNHHNRLKLCRVQRGCQG